MESSNHNCVILRTNRARYALNKKILIILNEESISGGSGGRASLYIQREVLPQMFEKASRSLKYDSNFFVYKHTHIHIYIYIGGGTTGAPGHVPLSPLKEFHQDTRGMCSPTKPLPPLKE